MLNLKIDEQEAEFGAAACDYFRTRTQLAMTEEQISALVSDYTESHRQQCREARKRMGLKAYFAAPRIKWGTGGDPEMLDLIERRRKVYCFTYLHWAWMQSATDWGKSLDGDINVTLSFSSEGRRLDYQGLATWFVNGSRNHGVGPVRGLFELDLDAGRLTDYTIFFLDREVPDGRLHADRAEVRHPTSLEGWLFTFRMRPPSSD